MHERRIPEWLRHAPTPGVRGFAVLAGIEAVVRGILISVFPLEVYRVLGDAALMSALYFGVGVLSLIVGLLVPALTARIPRRWVYTIGAALFILSAFGAATGQEELLVGALVINTVATVICFVCLNAYVLDYIAKADLGECETSRMFYSALGWTLGPLSGVTLLTIWQPAPFIISGLAALTMLAVFWFLRLGNGKLIVRARHSTPSPVTYLPRFFRQPRLVAGWLFAVIRSCGWWVYIVYLPIFAVEQGLGEQVGGLVLSFSNGCLFLAPVILRWVRRRSLRRAVRGAFAAAALCFGAAGALAGGLPALAVGCLVLGSIWLIVLDICAGLPFLMAVKPSERTEMSAVYASYRDVSGFVTPGVAWVVLLVAPVAAVFAAGAAAHALAFFIAARLHPRLGQARIRMEPPAPPLAPSPETPLSP